MSSIFEGFLASPEASLSFGDRSFVQAMLRFEAAHARARMRSNLDAVAASLPKA